MTYPGEDSGLDDMGPWPVGWVPERLSPSRALDSDQAASAAVRLGAGLTPASEPWADLARAEQRIRDMIDERDAATRRADDERTKIARATHGIDAIELAMITALREIAAIRAVLGGRA